MKKALVVGIDDYPEHQALHGCVNDASRIAEMLETNDDESPNFDVITLTENVTSKQLLDALKELFSGDCEVALFYFAGHGILDDQTNLAFLVTSDGADPNWGISLAQLTELANGAHPKIKSTVMVLDCCNSGYTGEVSGLNDSGQISHIGQGVTILTACDRQGHAEESSDEGLFTSFLLEGLKGQASDILGRVTPASLYALVDQTLGAWKQRPIYKANVRNFIPLRSVKPRVDPKVIRRLTTYFPTADHLLQIDPSYEPDRGEKAEQLSDIEVSEKNVRTFRDLQQCNRNGLVVPTSEPHMWHTAVNSGTVELTALGKHFHKLVKLGRI